MQLIKYTNIKHGEQTRLAKAIGVDPQLIHQWAHHIRPVPIGRCIPIERATNGAVSRRDLRPDDWHEIWPEYAAGVEQEGSVHA
ncbi:transcriptional regulator [Castellaniella hirudinis]|uniref:transcriptional regulator n=1 Tax=Castellaniella hirudinis TaxID=1144617 RepID=UPI0039C2AA03